MSTMSQKKSRTRQSGTAQVLLGACTGLSMADLSQVTWMIFSAGHSMVQEVHRILNDRGPNDGDVEYCTDCQIRDSP